MEKVKGKAGLLLTTLQSDKKAKFSLMRIHPKQKKTNRGREIPKGKGKEECREEVNKGRG